MASKKNGKGGGLRLYKSYMFKSKDPVIDELRTMVQDQFGSLKHKALRQVEEGGGPSVSCMIAWFHGDTKRPNSCSIEAAGRSMGKQRVWVNLKK